MKITQIGKAPCLCLWGLCLYAIPLMAQPQVGGGTCNSASLNGNYSLTLTGRALNGATPELFASALQGIGTAAFDGLSKVTFTFTENTNAASGASKAFAGTYSIQANCVGVLNITQGDTANFTLGVFASGANYIITGEDGTDNLIGSGNTLPATACSVSTLDATFSFNGNGFGLQTTTIATAFYVSGALAFDGNGKVSSGTWYSTSAYGVASPVSVTGTYTVSSSCTAAATLKDSAGNSYSLVFTITDAAGAFVFSAASPQMIFSGSGRPL